MILEDMIPKIQSGTLGGETYTLELSNGGLKIAFNPGYTLAADAKAAAEKAIADITSGAVKVTPYANRARGAGAPPCITRPRTRQSHIVNRLPRTQPR